MEGTLVTADGPVEQVKITVYVSNVSTQHQPKVGEVVRLSGSVYRDVQWSESGGCFVEISVNSMTAPIED